MKKDRSERKKRLVAGIKKQLKSLILPFCILAVIVAAVMIILFLKTEPETEEIIRINAYEEEEREIILENDRLKLVMNNQTTQFTVTDKKSGEVWKSNPDGAASDAIALGVEKGKLQSTILLTYSTINGVDTLYDNFTYSIENKIYAIEEKDNEIIIHYTIGDTEKTYYVPPVITAERFEGFLANMELSDASMVGEYYKKLDINNLSKKDKEEKESLLEKYPIMETEVIYVMRDTVKENLKKKFQEFFEAAGYTEEDYKSDKDLDLSVKTSEKPIYNLTVIYRLDENKLVVEVPFDQIEYKEDYPIYNISLLPYFGAGLKTEDGYMVVPEGGGAIINFNNGKVLQNSYYTNVYGLDMAHERKYLVHAPETYYSTFGLAKNGSSFICTLDDGEAYACIESDVSGKKNSYNYVNATFNVLHRDQYDIADLYNGEMYVYEKKLPNEKLVQTFHFVASDDYVDMALEYRDYIEEKYGDELELQDDTKVPVVMEVLCSVDKVKQILGVPVRKPLELTTFKEAKAMLQELYDDGLTNLSCKLTGWMNGGVNHKIMNNIKINSECGNSKSLKSLTKFAKNNGIEFYLDGITNYAYDSDIFDGFIVSRDAARFVSKEKTELHEYSTIWYGTPSWLEPYYLLKPSLIIKLMNKLEAAAKEYGSYGISYRDIGDDLSADYNKKNVVSLEAAKDMQINEVKSQTDKGYGIMINAGNEYMIPYVDTVTNVSLHGYEYSIIDENIPFFQIALHGYFTYTTTAINISDDYKQKLLESAEYGAGLYFIIMKEHADVLQKTYFTNYYGADYDAWYDQILEIYNRYNGELGHTFNQRIADHEILSSKVNVTTYEDGTKVYVNYNYDDYTTVDGIYIPAREYVVVK